MGICVKELIDLLSEYDGGMDACLEGNAIVVRREDGSTAGAIDAGRSFMDICFCNPEHLSEHACELLTKYGDAGGIPLEERFELLREVATSMYSIAYGDTMFYVPRGWERDAFLKHSFACGLRAAGADITDLVC